jgi:hypothetical protein
MPIFYINLYILNLYFFPERIYDNPGIVIKGRLPPALLPQPSGGVGGTWLS